MRKIIGIILAIIAIAGIVVLANMLLHNQETNTVIDKTAVDEKSEEELLNEEVEAELKMMTLDQKISQLLIVQAPSLTVSEQLAEQLKVAPYGGFILMENAYGTLASTREFVQKLRDLSIYPLIISTDQEGGNVQRMRKITSPSATKIPYASELGYIGSMELTRKVGGVVARELSAVGINVDYAPVLDVNSNPNNPIIGKRSFSKDPTMAYKMGAAFAEGLADYNVTAVYKHFPGHGDTSVDSHVNLPVINKTRAELDTVELVPFKEAIKDGAEMIMIAHIALPSITGDKTPATLSHKITTELLRDELGYKGLIVTDGLNMGALTKNYQESEIYWRAVEAGADLLLLPTNPDVAIKSIKEHISEERINESVRRILHYKLGTMKKWQLLDESNFASAENQAIVNQVK